MAGYGAALATTPTTNHVNLSRSTVPVACPATHRIFRRRIQRGSPIALVVTCPKREAKDGGHTAFTDHRVQRRPEPQSELPVDSELLHA